MVDFNKLRIVEKELSNALEVRDSKETNLQTIAKHFLTMIVIIKPQLTKPIINPKTNPIVNQNNEPSQFFNI